jgi:hypothetical protein
MKKKIFLFLPVCFFSVVSLWAAEPPEFRSALSLQVDGVYTSTSVVVTGRQPVFSWEYASGISSFTVTVSTSTDTTTPLWTCAGSTTAANSINFITRIPFNTGGTTAELQPYTTYWWAVELFNEGSSSMSAVNQFFTVAAAVTLNKEKFDLAVDWNNPFNPAKGQITKFRFTAKDRDRSLQLRVYSVSGDLVMEWPAQFALKDAWYTIDWNGTNDNGEIVGRGIYLVNLEDVSEHKGVTRKVIVVK